MATERYVVLGLARVGSSWFRDVARWSTSGSLAADFVKTVSAEEVRIRLASRRPFSALLVDGGLPGVDRDLLESAVDNECAAIVVSDAPGRDWEAMGATACLPASFDTARLAAVLAEHARPIRRADDVPGQVHPAPVPPGFRGSTVAVTGPGGTGRSVSAAAIAQGFGADVVHADTVVLADLALHAGQAVLHDAGDVAPGLVELVEAHRVGDPSPDAVRELCFRVTDRRYRLLLGLRRHREWTALRPRAVAAAVDGLRRAFTLVVADVDDDLEGEAVTGSADVEDRNVLARTTLEVADVVVVVGAPGVLGVRSLLRVVREVLAAGVEAERVVPVVNRAPKKRMSRREVAQAATELMAASGRPGGLPGPVLSPVFVPDLPRLESAIRDGTALPPQMVRPLVGAVRSRLSALENRPTPALSAPEPVPVGVGSLGTWGEEVSG
jgi:hypothetical protein